ncbi:MAG: hypothetical protein V1701_02915 [Planctomycetota bacterium]
MPNPLGQRESAAIPELDASLIWKKEPRYDSFQLAAGGVGVNIMTFFQVPRNVAGSGFAVAKTEAETNMQTAGQIGKPNQFLLYGFTVEVLPAQAAALAISEVSSNWALIYHPSVFRFVLGANNIQLEVPLEKIPTGVGPTGFATSVGAAAVTTPQVMSAMTNGVPHSRYYYNFTVPGSKLPLLIQGDQTFRCEIAYPLGNLILTVHATRVRCYMHGVYGQGK